MRRVRGKRVNNWAARVVTSRRRLIRKGAWREIDAFWAIIARGTHRNRVKEAEGGTWAAVIDGSHAPGTDGSASACPRSLSPAAARNQGRASQNNSDSSHLALVTLLLRIGLPAARKGHKGFGPERGSGFCSQGRQIIVRTRQREAPHAQTDAEKRVADFWFGASRRLQESHALGSCCRQKSERLGMCISLSPNITLSLIRLPLSLGVWSGCCRWENWARHLALLPNSETLMKTNAPAVSNLRAARKIWLMREREASAHHTRYMGGWPPWMCARGGVGGGHSLWRHRRRASAFLRWLASPRLLQAPCLSYCSSGGSHLWRPKWIDRQIRAGFVVRKRVGAAAGWVRRCCFFAGVLQPNRCLRHAQQIFCLSPRRHETDRPTHGRTNGCGWLEDDPSSRPISFHRAAIFSIRLLLVLFHQQILPFFPCLVPAA